MQNLETSWWNVTAGLARLSVRVPKLGVPPTLSLERSVTFRHPAVHASFIMQHNLLRPCGSWTLQFKTVFKNQKWNKTRWIMMNIIDWRQQCVRFGHPKWRWWPSLRRTNPDSMSTCKSVFMTCSMRSEDTNTVPCKDGNEGGNLVKLRTVVVLSTSPTLCIMTMSYRK